MGQYFPADRMGRLMNVVRSAAFGEPTTGKVYIISYRTSCKKVAIGVWRLTVHYSHFICRLTFMITVICFVVSCSDYTESDHRHPNSRACPLENELVFINLTRFDGVQGKQWVGEDCAAYINAVRPVARIVKTRRQAGRAASPLPFPPLPSPLLRSRPLKSS